MPQCIPPAPEVFNQLYMEYIRNGKPAGLTFRQYLSAIGFVDHSIDTDGMDDGALTMSTTGGPTLISVPHVPITGLLNIIVLLVDFEDNKGQRSPDEYNDLLFSKDIFPTGSMRDYYREISGGKVTVDGSIHGWLRMPETYAYYVNNQSGTGSYPRNSQKLAEDAVEVALAAGVQFPEDLDALGNGAITGLFIVHAGRGAEQLHPTINKKHIWSHKWFMPNPVDVRPGLTATTYLTVPEDCRMGVCAHELGHLAFQWEDFYDPNGMDDGVSWSGSGKWDLMAAGSWNDSGDRPAHPAGLHKIQHGWQPVKVVNASEQQLVVKPMGSDGGGVVKIISPAFTNNQFLLLENRRRTGFDDHLPGEGLLVWRVDLDRPMVAPSRPALQLAQADGQSDLERPPSAAFINQGDAGDPFPGSTQRASIGPIGNPTTSFLGQSSGVELRNIKVDFSTGNIVLDVVIDSAQSTAPVPPTTSHKTASAGPDGGPPPNAAAYASKTPRGAASNLDCLSSPEKPAPKARRSMDTGLERLLAQPNVSPEELEPFVRAVTPTPLDLERRALGSMEPRTDAGGLAAAPGFLENVFSSGFDSFWFRRYKEAFNIQWDVEGSFEGSYTLEQTGPREYLYIPDPGDPFRFTRGDGTVIQPGRMVTDGGSVPRVAWVIPDINPWTYIKAYLIHDWDFGSHRCTTDYDRTFEEANLTLGEGIYTLMLAGEVSTDWRKVELVYQAVGSFVGRGVWDRSPLQGECEIALPR